MPTYYASLFDTVRDVIGSAWPDVPANGIYDAIALATVPFKEKATSGALPLAMVDYRLESSGELGVVNRVDEGILSIYFIAKNTTRVTDLTTRLETLRNLLWPDVPTDPLSPGQVMEYPSVSWSMDLALNDYFLRTMQPVWAGVVMARIAVGYTP